VGSGAELRVDRWAFAVRGGYEHGAQGWSRREVTDIATGFF
jgi:hypothetical protein